MYTLFIEQENYNRVSFAFDNLKDLLTFIEDVRQHCGKQTTFTFEFTEGGEE